MPVTRTRNWWTPQRVVKALANYPYLSATLEAGMLAPGEEGGGSGEWESGSAIEKLCLVKADVDQGLQRIPPQLAAAVRAYYVDGHETFRAVALRQGISLKTAQRYVQQGVARLARLLCNARGAGSHAVSLMQDARRAVAAERKLTQKPVGLTHSAVREHENGAEGDGWFD